MTPHGLKVLKALAQGSHPDEPWYFHMKTLATNTGFTRSFTRRTVRYLARKGLAEYSRGLWTEDNTPAGAGYCITRAGREVLGQ